MFQRGYYMQESKSLGIYIPTKDRPTELEECLNSIIPQVRQYSFPIYVSDNSTTNKTEKLVARIKKSVYAEIFYKKNDSEAGNTFASNLLSVLKMGCTEFVWIISDDDALENNAIDTVSKELLHFGYLQVLLASYSRDLKKKLPEPAIKSDNITQIYKKGHHNLALKKASKIHIAGYLSELIIKKSAVDKVMHENITIRDSKIFSKITKEEMETEYLHILFFLAIIGHKGKLITKPLIKYRCFNTRINDPVKVAFYNMYRAINYLRPEYGDDLCNQAARPANPTREVVIAKRRHPELMWESIRIIWDNKRLDVQERTFLILLLLVPSSAYNLIRKVLILTSKIEDVQPT